MTSTNDCLFCKIVRGDIKGDLVFQDETITAFRDINPQAPVHVLLVPNEHIASTSELRPEHDALIGRLVRTAGQIAEREGVAARGYRLVTNSGPDSGQTVQHLHLHLLGGRRQGWPPG
jgi:histidine triad (HIT) family protein